MPRMPTPRNGRAPRTPRCSMRGRTSPGLGGIRGGPVVLGEHERGEIDFPGELDEAVECGPPRIERRCPRLDVCDIREPTGDRLEQFGLLARRPEIRGLFMHPEGSPGVASVGGTPRIDRVHPQPVIQAASGRGTEIFTSPGHGPRDVVW